jgi:hypothetical protein
MRKIKIAFTVIAIVLITIFAAVVFTIALTKVQSGHGMETFIENSRGLAVTWANVLVSTIVGALVRLVTLLARAVYL